MDPEEVAVAKKFGRNLAERRSEAGRSVEDLAAAAGISAKRVRELEDGSEIVGGELFFVLATLLGVTVDDLLAGIEWREPPDCAFYIDGERVK